MAYSFLVFDFGGNETVAQEARQKIEGWRQGYRLDKKMQVRFERNEASSSDDPASGAEDEKPETAAKNKAESKSRNAGKTARSKSAQEKNAGGQGASETDSAIRLLVRLDFSDHEKLSHHRWLERIPTEEPFKSVKHTLLRPDHADFTATSELFDSLDGAARPTFGN